MAKILLLSDTHSYIDNKILTYASIADEVWHAGDIGSSNVAKALQKANPNFKAVYGNIDDYKTRAIFPEHLFFDCEGVSIWLTHIGGYPPNYTPNIKAKLIEHKPKIFICGHSHILKIIYDTKLSILHLNPGAIGIYGIHQKRTMLRFKISKQDIISEMDIIEFDK